MAKTTRQSPVEPAEIPIDKPKPRRVVKPQAITLDNLKTNGSATAVVELPSPRADLPPPDDREVVPPNPNTQRPRPSHDRNGEEHDLGQHTAAVLARRPSFAPVPEGFKNVVRHESVGIRVNKGIERNNTGTAAIQLSEDRPLSRATEYDLMEEIQKAGFHYKPANRQWERPLPEGMTPGENIIEAVRLAGHVAEARGAERGR